MQTTTDWSKSLQVGVGGGAERLRDAGHDVVVWDQAGGDIECDISQPEAVTAAMSQTERDHGAPTRMLACAGVGASGTLLVQSAAELQPVLAVNLTGAWLTTQAAAQAMIDAALADRSLRCPALARS